MGDDTLARSAMHAIAALVGALRDADMLTEDFVRAVDDQSRRALNYAGVIEGRMSQTPDPDEAMAIRHGIWWLRECVAPIATYHPGPVATHPKHHHEWPDLLETWRHGGQPD